MHLNEHWHLFIVGGSLSGPSYIDAMALFLVGTHYLLRYFNHLVDRLCWWMWLDIVAKYEDMVRVDKCICLIAIVYVVFMWCILLFLVSLTNEENFTA